MRLEKSGQVACIAVGALLLIASPLAFFLATLIACAVQPLIFPGLWEKLAGETGRNLDSQSWKASLWNWWANHWHVFVVGASVCASAGLTFFTLEIPPDDMLRHAVAWHWEFDATKHYPESHFTHTWSWWIGWEKLFQYLSMAGLDTVSSIGIVRSCTVVITGYLAWKAVSKVVIEVDQPNRTGEPRFGSVTRVSPSWLPEAISKPFAVSLFAMVFFGIVWPRLSFGRPESLLFLSLFLGLVSNSRWTWLVLMLPLIPVYWMSPIYAAGALMHTGHQRPLIHRTRTEDKGWNGVMVGMAFAAFYVLASVSFWLMYSKGEYLDIPKLMGPALEFSRYKVAELQGNVAAFGSPKNVLVLSLTAGLVIWFSSAITRAIKEGDRFGYAILMNERQNWALVSWTGVAMVLCLPDMVRYMPYIETVLLLICAVLMRTLLSTQKWVHEPVSRSWMVKAGACLVLFALVQLPATKGRAPEHILRGDFTVPPGSKVLAQFNTSAYLMTASNPRSRVTPVYEIGAVTSPMRETVAAFSLGQWPTCDVIKRYDFLAETGVHGAVPPCVRVKTKTERFTLWSVVPESDSAVGFKTREEGMPEANSTGQIQR